ncbi:hypothetical protein SK128_018097 [Halocaridina rubra]|uniref:C2H2-type domain-containing protein n=1 Tax=Halocaridina rubra TaxID=373956 RepID=A0AAN8XCR7_HALRR
MEIYDDSIRPHALPCGHTICTNCVTSCLKDDQIKCPHCQRCHNASSAKDIPVNYEIESIISILRQTKLEISEGGTVSKEPKMMGYKEDTTEQVTEETVACSSDLLHSDSKCSENHVHTLKETKDDDISSCQLSSDDIHLGQVSSDSIPLDQLSSNNIPLGRRSSDDIPFGQLPSDNTSLGQLSNDDMPLGQVSNSLYQNSTLRHASDLVKPLSGNDILTSQLSRLEESSDVQKAKLKEKMLACTTSEMDFQSKPNELLDQDNHTNLKFACPECSMPIHSSDSKEVERHMREHFPAKKGENESVSNHEGVSKAVCNADHLNLGKPHDSNESSIDQFSGQPMLRKQHSETGDNEVSSPENVKEDILECPICGLTFQPGSIRMLEEHINSCSEQVCSVCSRAFERGNDKKFVEHVEEHFRDNGHGEDSLCGPSEHQGSLPCAENLLNIVKCPVCSMVFQTVSPKDFEKHVQEHFRDL